MGSLGDHTNVQNVVEVGSRTVFSKNGGSWNADGMWHDLRASKELASDRSLGFECGARGNSSTWTLRCDSTAKGCRSTGRCNTCERFAMPRCILYS